MHLVTLHTKLLNAWHAATQRFRNEEGAVATEYVLLLVLVGIAIAATAGLLGTALKNKFTTACNSIGGASC
jgi:Flp pilus assembly pilin Flp